MRDKRKCAYFDFHGYFNKGLGVAVKGVRLTEKVVQLTLQAGWNYLWQ